jgi:hypothetical protein
LDSDKFSNYLEVPTVLNHFNMNIVFSLKI